jgi:hypothetical protein
MNGGDKRRAISEMNLNAWSFGVRGNNRVSHSTEMFSIAWLWVTMNRFDGQDFDSFTNSAWGEQLGEV